MKLVACTFGCTPGQRSGALIISNIYYDIMSVIDESVSIMLFADDCVVVKYITS